MINMIGGFEMKSKWKVTSNPVGDRTLYGVFRIINTNEVDHSGNRELYHGYLESRQEAAALAASLNAAENHPLTSKY